MWSHELAMVSLFFIVFGMIILSIIRKQKAPKRLSVAILLATLLSMGNLFYIPPFASPINTNLTRIYDSTWAHPAGLFFLTDYLNTKNPIENYNTYINLASNVTTLFLIMYALILPQVIIGYIKDSTLTVWTLLSLMGGGLPDCSIFCVLFMGTMDAPSYISIYILCNQ